MFGSHRLERSGGPWPSGHQCFLAFSRLLKEQLEIRDQGHMIAGPSAVWHSPREACAVRRQQHSHWLQHPCCTILLLRIPLRRLFSRRSCRCIKCMPLPRLAPRTTLHAADPWTLQACSLCSIAQPQVHARARAAASIIAAKVHVALCIICYGLAAASGCVREQGGRQRGAWADLWRVQRRQGACAVGQARGKGELPGWLCRAVGAAAAGCMCKRAGVGKSGAAWLAVLRFGRSSGRKHVGKWAMRPGMESPYSAGWAVWARQPDAI